MGSAACEATRLPPFQKSGGHGVIRKKSLAPRLCCRASGQRRAVISARKDTSPASPTGKRGEGERREGKEGERERAYRIRKRKERGKGRREEKDGLRKRVYRIRKRKERE